MPAPGEIIALEDVKRVVGDHGQDCRFQLNEDTPADVSRDKLKSVQRFTGVYLTERAFPIRYSPTDKELSRAGIMEKVDVLIYTSTLLWRENHTKNFKDLYPYLILVQLPDTKEVYRAKHIRNHMHFGDDFLYIVFGLVKN